MNIPMLSTIDNPYNPFTQYDEWYAYDTREGHNTAAFLARITQSSHDLSEEDQNLAISHAIEEIIRENVSGIYIKIEENENNN